jgi:PAS domain S-box-containing protein
MKNKLNVLIVEDSEEDAILLARELSRGGFDPSFRRVETAEEMRAALEKADWDVILSDHAMPRLDSLGALGVLKESGEDVPFIIVSGSIGEEKAVAAMKAGAADYIMKDNLKRLVPAIDRELADFAQRREKRKAEERLVESEARYRALVEEQLEAVCRWLPDTTLTFVNRAYCRLMGKSREELAGVKWIGFIPERRRAEVMDVYAKAAAAKQTVTYEHEVETAEGERWYRWTDVPLLGNNGGLLEFQSVGHDVTEQRKAQDDLRRQLDELRRWQEVMLDREERAIELKKEVNGLLRELGRPEKYGV